MGHTRNWRGTRSATALLLVAAGLGLVPGTALASAKTDTVTVAGISRTGATVAVVSEVTPLHGNAEPGTGPVYHLKPGVYFIAADVLTPASGPTAASQTLVVRRVSVRGDETVKLDSRGGKLFSAWLNGKEIGAPPVAGACIAEGHGVVYSDPDDGPLYVEPTVTARVSFVWALTIGVPSGTIFDLTGQDKAGLPARPTFRLRTSGLIKTVILARAGTVPTTSGFLATSSTISACTLTGMEEPLTPPVRLTVYRSPAAWTTELDTNQGIRLSSASWRDDNETAGHAYTISLGDASRGPSEAVPVIQGTKLAYDPHHQFLDPFAQGYDYFYQATVTLSSGGHTIRTQRFGQALRNFTSAMHAGRWYVLTTDARQLAPSAELAGLLSPRTTLSWRFKVAKAITGAIPVAVTSLEPQGLDLRNLAAPSSMTSVRAYFTQGSYSLVRGLASADQTAGASNHIFAPPPAVPVRSFTAQASFNEGKTWHSVPVVKHKGYWTFVVRNPAAGYVTLRTTTVNSLGNSSVQTTYRAYGIR